MLKSTLEIIRGADEAMMDGWREMTFTVIDRMGSDDAKTIRSELTTWAKTHGVGFEFYTIDEFGNGLVEKVRFRF